MQEFKRKINRLDLLNYQGNNFYFITICCKGKSNFFENAALIVKYIGILRSAAQKEYFNVWIYCFMPNHLHLLLEGGKGSDLIRFIQHYKQMTGYDFKQTTGQNLWQKSFYDHILRKDEVIYNVALYILNNPVRKGIANHYLDYHFSGSFVIDIREL